MTDDPNNPRRHGAVQHGGAITPGADAVRASVVQEFRVLEPAKPMKTGRPKLPTGTAKGRIVHVRFTPEEIERITAAAKASNKTVSEWIRSTANAAIES
jgi:mobilization protein NikA